MVGPESLDEQVSSSDTEDVGQNPLVGNDSENMNVFQGDVEEAKEAAETLGLEEEKEEDEGHDPYNKQ